MPPLLASHRDEDSSGMGAIWARKHTICPSRQYMVDRLLAIVLPELTAEGTDTGVNVRDLTPLVIHTIY